MKQRVLNLALSLIIMLTSIFSITIPTSAKITEEEYEELNDYVLGAMADIKKVMEDSYAAKEKSLSELSAQGYDYELTSESFYEKGTPYLDFDYKRFIAAYACIQTYCLEHGIDMKDGINGIDFIKMDYEDDYIKEYIPERIPRYKKEGAFYVKDGEYYLTEPSDIYVYEEIPKGYKRKEKVHKDLKTKKTKYANITLSVISVDEVYEHFGLDPTNFKKEEDKRLYTIKEALGEIKPEQATFVVTRKTTESKQNITKVADALSFTADMVNRQALIQTASSIMGAVPYEWGGKSRIPGYDPLWWTFNDKGNQSGLDCSGYVQWVLRTSGYESWAPLVGTNDFLKSKNLEIISAEDLLPGDLGLFYPEGATTNHIGIYLGNGYWIHCSSSKKTVVVSNSMKFALYRRIKGIDDGTFTLTPYYYGTENVIAMADATVTDDTDAVVPENVEDTENVPESPVEVVMEEPETTENNEENSTEETEEEAIPSEEPKDSEEAVPVSIEDVEPEEEIPEEPVEDIPAEEAPQGEENQAPEVPVQTTSAQYADSELYLLAKIVQLEAYGEGFNGWVAVAEVIKNRVNSPSFTGNNVRDIVSAPRQFSTYKKAQGMSDSEVDGNVLEVCREVMNGQLAVFNDGSVIAFKRNDGSGSFGKWKLYKVLGNHAFYHN